MNIQHITTKQMPQLGDTVITLGNFDGLHLGHQRLIQTAISDAARVNARAVVFSFFPHPMTVLRGEVFRTLLTSDEKKALLDAAGVDVFIEYPFDTEVADMDAEEFVRGILCDKLRCRELVVGEGYRFGRGGMGDCEALKRLGAVYGFGVTIIPHVMMHGGKISSTTVRELIKRQHIAEARQLMGRPYIVTGEIVHGNRLGRTINIPTANIRPPEYKLLPPSGVYRSEIKYLGRVYRGLTNVGTRPTVCDGREKVVETHLLGFDGDLYGRILTVEFSDWIRPETKFVGMEALRAQIVRDIATVCNRL